ncbi:aminopeptidase P family protein [Nitratireductor mangrovi]|uniref:Aminopeptidase P family protein n=1 Tax=Nitratireductor mangrovi TaxID=2599600 RepID=A0A5B8L4N9_9HYPH|nr:Xaa-Pro peptidase family protein [Nitratireductor mangrovi]QDZ02915.1 aminopeptidase P family protein [Nitratireductor mangrovi]
MDTDPKAGFGRHRKIMPFLPDLADPRDEAALLKASREKAGLLNQHVLGYGALAEAEWAAAGIPDPDLGAMRRYRLERIRAELARHDYAGLIVYDPVNIRYATDSTNMQLWVTHNATRFCFVGANGRVILYDYHHSEHLSDHSGVVDEVRPCLSTIFMYGGDLITERIGRWADEVADLVRTECGTNRRIAFDLLQPDAYAALVARGISVHDGQQVIERARSVKSPDEILCMRRAITACERAMGEMEAGLRPGMSENDLWALLHHGNIVRGGEWIETRLLASGPRTNPWFQESSSRVIEAGDLVAFDTDLIGPYGFCADISRTWLAGDGLPDGEQRTLYGIAADQVAHNTALLKPGMSFRELWETAKLLPEDCLPNRYGCLYHGAGLCDEYPTIPYPQDVEPDIPADDVLLPGMVLCVESYTGRLGGHEGVKLEQQVLITETGCEQLSAYPLDERLG